MRRGGKGRGRATANPSRRPGRSQPRPSRSAKANRDADDGQAPHADFDKAVGATRGRTARRTAQRSVPIVQTGAIQRGAQDPAPPRSRGTRRVRGARAARPHPLPRGQWKEAVRELEAFRELTGSAEQNPVLADCHRAMGHFGQVETLWDELREASPSADLVAEGRIVAAGALADQGRLADAIRLLESGRKKVAKPKERHLRMAYALADLYERAGDVPGAVPVRVAAVARPGLRGRRRSPVELALAARLQDGDASESGVSGLR